MKLSNQLTLKIALPIYLILIVLVSISTYLSYIEINKLNKNYFDDMNQSLLSNISIFFTSKKELVSSYASDEFYADFLEDNRFSKNTEEDINKIQSSLSKTSKTIPHIHNMNLVSLDGLIVNSSNKGLIREKSLVSSVTFQNAIKNPYQVAVSGYDFELDRIFSDEEEPLFSLAKVILSVKTNLPVGVIFISIRARAYLEEMFGTSKPFGDGYVYISSSEDTGDIIYNPDRNIKKVQKEVLESYEWKNKQDGIITSTDEKGEVEVVSLKYEYISRTFIGITVPYKSMNRNISKLIFKLQIISVGFAPLIFFIVYFIIIRLVSNIKEIIKHIEILAKGDYTFWIPSAILDREDEMGELSKSIMSISRESKKFIIETKNNFDSIAMSLKEIITSSSTININSGTQMELSKEISKSIGGMIEEIKEAQDINKDTDQILTQSFDISNISSNVVKQSIEDIKEIFNKIVIIQELSTTTALISLNAAVEASRAGGAIGQSFSVVATEIRTLSERSLNVSNQILDLTKKSLENSKISNEAINRIIPEIQKSSDRISISNKTTKGKKYAMAQIKQSISILEQLGEENSVIAEKNSKYIDNINTKAFEISTSLNNYIVHKREIF